jgi:hypothetical protein
MLLRSVESYVPGMYRRLSAGRTDGTNSAEYCYTVWLRHLIYANKYSQLKIPHRVAEIGPGDSLGIGLAALISGANEYYAFDVVESINVKRNLKIFDELTKLFETRHKIPDGTNFPRVRPVLDSYDFPHDILTETHLKDALNPRRLDQIKDAIINVNNPKCNIKIYYSPEWYEKTIKEQTIDMILSQAVMEHIDELENSYKAMYKWLVFGGVMSHDIDFKCHGFATKWNGHLTYSDITWKLIRGKLPYLINREPHSKHLELMKNNGFKILVDKCMLTPAGVTRESLAPRFKNVTDDDLRISESYILATK